MYPAHIFSYSVDVKLEFYLMSYTDLSFDAKKLIKVEFVTTDQQLNKDNWCFFILPVDEYSV